MAYKAERMRERLTFAERESRLAPAGYPDGGDIGDRRRLDRPPERESDRSRRDRSPSRNLTYERPIPEADLPEIGSIVMATVTSIKGNLGLFVETPTRNGLKVSGLIHLSEVRRCSDRTLATPGCTLACVTQFASLRLATAC
jgi:hypothetical protein